MAKQSISKHVARPPKKRPGVHAKTKTTMNKNATNYKKPYVGQGR